MYKHLFVIFAFLFLVTSITSATNNFNPYHNSKFSVSTSNGTDDISSNLNSDEHPKNCTCAECKTKAASMKMHTDHEKSCDCDTCKAHKAMKDKHPKDCTCDMCKAHKSMNKKHPADCKCDMCRTHSETDKSKECCADSTKDCHSSEATEKTSTIWNKYCPVKGGEVDPEAPTAEYMGKKIGFCCPGCDKKFSANPEKYIKNLSEDGQTFNKKS